MCSEGPNHGIRYSPPPSPSVVILPPIQPPESVAEPSTSSGSNPMVMPPATSSESDATPPSPSSQPMATPPDPSGNKARSKPRFQPLEIPPRPIYQPRMMSPTTHSRPMMMSPAQHRQSMVMMLPSPRSRMHSVPPPSPSSQRPVMTPAQPVIASPKPQCRPLMEIPPRPNYQPRAILSPTPHSHLREPLPAAAPPHGQTPDQQSTSAMSPKPPQSTTESPTPRQLEPPAAAALSPTPQNQQHVSGMSTAAAAAQHGTMMVPYAPPLQHYHQHFMLPAPTYNYQPAGAPFNLPIMMPAGFQAPNHFYPEHERAWSTHLFDCTKDIRNCTRTIFCPCVTFGQIADIVNEGTTPWYEAGLLCALLGASKAMTIFAPWCCHPSFPYTGFYRTKLRRKYKLKGSVLEDYLVHCCCECCALCQEFRELDHQGFDVPLGWHENKRRERQAVAIFRFIPPEEQGMTR